LIGYKFFHSSRFSVKPIPHKNLAPYAYRTTSDITVLKTFATFLNIAVSYKRKWH